MNMETFRRKNDLVKQYAADAGRDDSAIERALTWTSPADADAFAAEGVTLFTTGIEPTDDSYNFTELTDMLAWRGSRH
jgi:hypothetical protein